MFVWIGLIIYIFVVKFFVGPLRSKEKQKRFLIWAGIGIVLIMGARGHEYAEVYDVWVYYHFYEDIAQAPWREIFEVSGFEPGYVLLNKLLATLVPWAQMILIVEAAFCVYAVSRFIYLNSEYPFECIYFFITLETMAFYLTAFRQAFAISICLLSIELIKKRRFKTFCLAILVAASFHKTAIVFFPAYFFVCRRLSVRQKMFLLFAVLVIGLNAKTFLMLGNAWLGFDYDSRYIGNRYGGIVPILIYLIITAYSFGFFKGKYKDNANVGVNMTLIGLGIYICRYSVQILQRMSFFYTPGSIIALPEVINHVREPRLRFSLRTLAIILAFILFLRRIGYSEYGNYQFFW